MVWFRANMLPGEETGPVWEWGIERGEEGKDSQQTSKDARKDPGHTNID